MKRKYLYLAIMFLALPLTLLACNPQEAEPAETTTPPVDETTAAPMEEIGYEGLGLTEEEIRMLEERGIANVESAEVASKIAGFTVAEATHVPDGFIPGKFSIQISGGGMPEGISPKFNNTKVERVYSHEDGKTMILLIQSPQQLNVGGAEPVEICGHTGERKFSPADPDKGMPYDKLTYGWEKDGFYYALTGMLSETLDEEEMEKMACSISAE